MRRSCLAKFWLTGVFSFTLLAANVLAPFRTHAHGRVLLTNLSPTLSSLSKVETGMTVAPARAGFRAIVGLCPLRGKQVLAATGMDFESIQASFPLSLEMPLHWPVAWARVCASIPLRC